MEHSLLIALIAIGLLVVLARFVNGVGGVTKRSAATVSTRVYGGGYGQTGGAGAGSIATTYEDRPSTPPPDSTASEPDSSLAGEGGSAAAQGLGGY